MVASLLTLLLLKRMKTTKMSYQKKLTIARTKETPSMKVQEADEERGKLTQQI
jgi:hypothetical protein